MADEDVLTPAQVLERLAAEQGGMVTPEQLLEAKNAERGPVGSAVKKAASSALGTVTRGVARGIEGLGQLDVAAGLKTPEQAKSRAETYAKILVPQNTPQALGMLGMAAGAPLGPLGSVVGGGAGYGLGSALEGDPLPTTALTALGGAAAGAGGEILGKVGNTIATGFTGMKQKLADAAARRVGQVVDDLTRPHAEVAPGMMHRRVGGPQSSQELSDWAGYQGLAEGSAAKDATMRTVDDLLRTTLGPTRGTPTIVVEGRHQTVQQANDRLSEIGAKAFSKNPADHTFGGIDQRRLYGAVRKEIADGITQLHPLAGAVWNKGQNAYENTVALEGLLTRPGVFLPTRDRLTAGTGTIGEGLRKIMRGEGGFSGTVGGLIQSVLPGAGNQFARQQGTMLNAGTLQAYLQTPDGKGIALKRYGPEGYEQLMKALIPGRVPYELNRAQQALVDALVTDLAEGYGMRPGSRPGPADAELTITGRPGQ